MTKYPLTPNDQLWSRVQPFIHISPFLNFHHLITAVKVRLRWGTARWLAGCHTSSLPIGLAGGIVSVEQCRSVVVTEFCNLYIKSEKETIKFKRLRNAIYRQFFGKEGSTIIVIICDSEVGNGHFWSFIWKKLQGEINQ